MCSELSALGTCISIACTAAIDMLSLPLMLPSSHFPVSTRHYNMICTQEGTASKEWLLHVMAAKVAVLGRFSRSVMLMWLQGQQPVILKQIRSMRPGWSLATLQSRSDAQKGPPRPSASLAADLPASTALASSAYCRLHPPGSSGNGASSGVRCTLHAYDPHSILSPMEVED